MFTELDNGGIREAYRAYHKHLKTVGTEPQLPGLTNFSLDQVSVEIDFSKKAIIMNLGKNEQFLS